MHTHWPGLLWHLMEWSLSLVTPVLALKMSAVEPTDSCSCRQTSWAKSPRWPGSAHQAPGGQGLLKARHRCALFDSVKFFQFFSVQFFPLEASDCPLYRLFYSISHLGVFFRVFKQWIHTIRSNIQCLLSIFYPLLIIYCHYLLCKRPHLFFPERFVISCLHLVQKWQADLNMINLINK